MRKIIALVMATLMVAAMAFTAFAVNITIKADSTFTSGTSGSNSGDLYTWYRVFTAVMDPSGTTTGGGSGSFWYKSGTGYYEDIDASSYGKVAYTASLKVAKLLGTYDADTNTWTANDDQPWFTLTPIAGTDPQTFSVTWNESQNDKTGANIRAAADYLYKNQIWDETGSFTYSDSDHCWTADVEAGYYVVSSAVGKNLIAATTDIEIDEKNVYPSLDKTQADEDDKEQSDDARPVAVGDVIKYQVKVTVPATVKVGDVLTVWDKASKGLTYNDDMVVSPAVATEATKEAGEAWRYEIAITSDNIGTLAGEEVIFSFSMTVNSDALVDTDKENESGLEYGDGSGTYFETVPDEVEFETYYGGIIKKDGNTKEVLKGVTFTLYETFSGTTVEYPVTQSGSFYYPATSGTSGSAVVTTGPSGTIIIRGLDGNKKYTLVELATLTGYNLMSGTTELVLTKDESGTDYYATAIKTEVLNFSGTVLPSTGGIGTTIFYIVGGLLAVGAGVVLVAKKRMGKVED